MTPACVTTQTQAKKRGCVLHEKEAKKREDSVRKQREIVRARAVKRLWRDWREVKKNPLPTVTAEPKDDNIFDWYGI